MYTGWERRNLSLTKLYLSSWPYYFPLPKKKKNTTWFILRIHRTVNSYFRPLNTLIFTLLTILFSQPWNELLWWDHANLLLLRGNAVEKVCQACQQVFLLFLLGLVCQHILTERPAEIQGLKHGVTVACVPKLPKDNRDGSNHGLGTWSGDEWVGRWRRPPPSMNRPGFPYIRILPARYVRKWVNHSNHQRRAEQQGNEYKFT